MEYLWDWYNALSAERGSNGFSVNPIRSIDVKNYSIAHGITIEPHEIEIIVAIDRIYMRVSNG